MKPHDHPHGHAHHHEHSEHEHLTATSREGGNDESFGNGLLMTSSGGRVLGALVLIALLWLSVAWAVLFID
jgi:hypothetical protein